MMLSAPPCFGTVFVAATYHVGPLLTSGHYTCSLIAADQAWYCDDGVQPPPELLGFRF